MTFIALFFSLFLFRHSQTQNTSFRSLLSGGNDCEQDVGSNRPESKPDTAKTCGREPSSIFQTKVSRYFYNQYRVHVMGKYIKSAEKKTNKPTLM